MRKLNPEYIAAVGKIVNGSPYFGLISMDIKTLSWSQSRLEMRVERKHLQPFGMIHGGVCASLVDAAAFWAVYTELDETSGLTTVEMKLNYLAAVSEGLLVAKGRSIRVGGALCLGEGTVEDEKGRLIAHGTSTMMILNQSRGLTQWKLPPKFLDA